jgi:hypothetical protein
VSKLLSKKTPVAKPFSIASVEKEDYAAHAENQPNYLDQ